MAGIKSLAVRGIRSFGPDKSDEQSISFHTPLTLILGQNGCGKTTIIECLRYAITGQMPPGSKDECFVHDAKVNKSTEVLGEVKLEILSPNDEQLEVSRAMRVTALPDRKVKFQTLSSKMKLTNEHGDSRDVTLDMDVRMSDTLGVSNAILNSVIFCHQEDSTWPLDDGQKVKERFDEIFDSEKYSECFEHLKKLRKEYSHEIKSLEQEVDYLFVKKEELEKKKVDVENTEALITEVNTRVEELSKELEGVTAKLDSIKTIEKSIVGLENKRDKIKVKLENFQTQEQEMKKIIKTIFEGTVEELNENINTYDQTVKDKQKELIEIYERKSAFDKEREKIENEMTYNKVKLNEFTFLENQNKEKVEKRNKLLEEAIVLAEMESKSIETDEEADKTFKALQQKVKELNKDLATTQSQADDEANKLQSHVNTSRDALSRHNEKISNKEIDIETAKKQILKKENEINDANVSRSRLEEIETKLKAAETEYQNAVSEVNTEDLQKEMGDDEKLIEQHEKELEELSQKITKLQKQTAKLAERNTIERSLKDKQEQLTSLLTKHSTAITELLGVMPEQDFALAINKLESETRGEVKGIKQKLKEKQKELTSVETERKMVVEMLSEKRAEIVKSDAKIRKACGTQTYDEVLAEVTNLVEVLQEKQAVLQASTVVIDKYKGQLKDTSCCPLCSRGFNSDDEVADLISQLGKQVLNVPAELEKVTEELQRTSAKKDELLALKNLNSKIAGLKEKEREIATRLEGLDEKIKTLQAGVGEFTAALKGPEQKMVTAKQVQGEMPLLDRVKTEIAIAAKNLEELNSEGEAIESDVTLEDATARQRDLRHEVSALRTRVRNSQKKLNAHTRKVQLKGEAKNKLNEKLLTIQKKVQGICTLQDAIKQLEEDKERCNAELKELQASTDSFKKDLQDKEDAKTDAVKKNRLIIESKRNYIAKVVKSVDKIKTVLSELKQHEEKKIPLQMKMFNELNDKLSEKRKQILIDESVLGKRRHILRDEIAKQEINQRDLQDNLKLRGIQTEIANCEKDMSEITEKTNGFNMDLLTEKGDLVAKEKQISKEREQNRGKLSAHKERLKQCKQDLQEMEDQGIERNYRQKYNELIVARAVKKDVKDYSMALEKCLLEFHKEKMKNINLIVREMWRKIYRGNDIDYIEIKTDGGLAEDLERYKYNYRVVQCKNGVEIDMRGRCSAGQKLLACLIIRLALAETFSTRFGVLALDEPTTNLDEENVKYLCMALNEIVQDRMSQKNFMFIIITHDKDFIDSLGHIDQVSHYYEVSRNGEGKSEVKKVCFS
ncbi:hypothetical protein MSG28_010093 [Choristoneura fumiferana]|uniref:Uncharacterized protein n=1 Tax=Choristoneura fumiferana TaxID=7141 RepID=A0ACC0KK96_CHOFU|nr:hypothetical protein MSG28_010093 [Choristoneura fumiferana]